MSHEQSKTNSINTSGDDDKVNASFIDQQAELSNESPAGINPPLRDNSTTSGASSNVTNSSENMSSSLGSPTSTNVSLIPDGLRPNFHNQKRKSSLGQNNPQSLPTSRPIMEEKDDKLDLSGGGSGGGSSSCPSNSNNPGSTITPSNPPTGISHINNIAQADIPDTGDSTPIGDSSLNEDLSSKAQRTKLNAKDICLILYLVVTYKPFKYIGDRNLSQTKKWEMIQSKYAELKQQERLKHNANNNHTLIIPTVRTLQRQLSSALKKAKLRKSNNDLNNDLPVFRNINRHSSLADLELATLELFELSETLKSGKVADSVLLEYSLMINSHDANLQSLEETSTGSQSNSGPGSTSGIPIVAENLPTSKPGSFSSSTSPQELSDTNMDQTSTYSKSVSGDTPKNLLNISNLTHNETLEPGQALTSLNSTRDSLKTFMADNSTSDQTILSLIETLIKEHNFLQRQHLMEISRLIDNNNNLIQQNKLFQLEQSNINRTLINDVINYMKNNSNITNETIKSFNDMIDFK